MIRAPHHHHHHHDWSSALTLAPQIDHRRCRSGRGRRKKPGFQLDLDAAVLLERAEEATKREEEGGDARVGEDAGYAGEGTHEGKDAGDAGGLQRGR